jgi:hypothetical protein
MLVEQVPYVLIQAQAAQLQMDLLDPASVRAELASSQALKDLREGALKLITLLEKAQIAGLRVPAFEAEPLKQFLQMAQ